MRRLLSFTAILGATLMAACTDHDPAGPPVLFAKGGNGGGGGGGGQTGTPTVELSGGLITPAPTGVSVVSDIATKLELGSHKFVFLTQISLTVDPAQCVVDPASTDPDKVTHLLTHLADATQQRHFYAYVDRTRLGLPSADHHFEHTFTDEDGGLYSIRLGPAPAMMPGVLATIHEDTPGVYRLEGGVVRIANRSGRVPQHFYVACPNAQATTMTFVRN